MAIVWGTTYTDSDKISYRLGYEATTTTTSTSITANLSLYLAAKAPYTGYYFSDSNAITYGAWGTSQASTDTLVNNTNKIQSTSIKSDIAADPSWTQWSIGSTSKTYTRGTSAASYVFTATLGNFEDLAKYPIVTYTLNVPRLNILTVTYNSNGANIKQLNGSNISEGAHSEQYLINRAYNSGLDNMDNPSHLYFEKTGYKPSGNWNTTSNGTGYTVNQSTSYATGAKLAEALGKNISTQDASVTVYAQWIPHQVKIKYFANGGSVTNSAFKLDTSDGTIHAISSDGSTTNTFHILNYGTSADPWNDSSFGLIRTGYTFAGWRIVGANNITLNQDTKYESTKYSQYDNSSKNTSNTETVECRLEAVWNINTYSNTIYHFRTIDGSEIIETSTFNAIYNANVIIPLNHVKSYPGFHVHDLAEIVNIGTLAIGSTFTQPAQDLEIYYYYEPNQYTIIYDSNGGTGSADDTKAIFNEAFMLGQHNDFSRLGYELIGWNLFRPDDAKWLYANEGWYMASEANILGYSKKEYPSEFEAKVDHSWIEGCEQDCDEFILYAVWKQVSNVRVYMNEHYAPGIFYIKHEGKWRQGVPYVKANNTWKKGGFY